jgi:hypothetical protein
MKLSDARREAYRYILESLGRLDLEVESQERGSPICIPLDELRLLKEGSAGPSARLVASLRLLLGDAVSPSEINAHLVAPFEGRCNGD